MTLSQPEYQSHEEFQNRSRKLTEIRALGVDPYPPKYVHTQRASQLATENEGKDVGHFDDAALGKTQHVFVSGRLVLFRAMGKNAFGHIQDETGRLQVMFNRDQTQVFGFEATPEDHTDEIHRKKTRSRRHHRSRRLFVPHSKRRADGICQNDDPPLQIPSPASRQA